MFSSIESEYLKGLINCYKKLGYNYYVAHTITEINNDYDFAVYFSKDKITCSSACDFNIPDNSIIVYVDSSSRNINSNGSRDILDYFHGSLHINIAEFIYTNAEATYTTLVDPINPDICYSGADTYNKNILDYSLLFIVCSIFIYMFIKSILRLRR